MCTRLFDPRWRGTFSYRGVELLGCLKKELFDEAFNLALGNFSSRLAEAPPARLKKNRPKFLPSFWGIGNLKKARVAVFSDFARSKSVLKQVRKSGCVLFAHQTSPRTFLRALVRQAAFFQIAYPACLPIHHTKTLEFIEEARKHRIFQDFSFQEIEGAGAFLQDRLEQLFRAILPRLLFEIDGIEKFFRSSPELRAALLDEDITPVKNAFCQLARRHGVKTFVELHGALGGKHGLVPLTADQMFVWGNAQKKRLMAWGCTENQIAVTGCSRYGPYRKMNPGKIRAQIARAFKLDPNRKIGLLVFAPITRWFFWCEREIKRVIGETLEVAAKLACETNVQFLIKLHPFDRNNPFYSRWVQSAGMARWMKVVPAYDPMLLAKAVDFLVVYGSTYAVDGLAVDKPVICLYDEEYPYPLLEEFRNFSAFYYSSSPETLKQIMIQLIQGEISLPAGWRQAQKECLNLPGKDPAEAIASILLNV